MKCPACKKRVKKTHFCCEIAKIAGRSRGKCKARDSEKMRAAVNKRWEEYRKKKGK